jgi:hypothetical protein
MTIEPGERDGRHRRIARRREILEVASSIVKVILLRLSVLPTLFSIFPPPVLSLAIDLPDLKT